MDRRWVTTTFGFDGARVTRHLGLVRGITVRSRSVVGNFGAGIQAMFGGNISSQPALFARVCTRRPASQAPDGMRVGTR